VGSVSATPIYRRSDPNGAWLRSVAADAKPFSWAPKTSCAIANEPGSRSYLRCLGPDEFVKDVFLDSDTASRRDAEPLTIAAADATRRRLNATRPYGISAADVRRHARRDRIAQERLAYNERPEPHYLTYGPKTRREFFNLLRWNGGSRA
jgi:hypothetical protein